MASGQENRKLIETDLRAQYQSAGQSHVFDHVDSLNENDRAEFFQQLSGIKAEQMNDLFKSSTKSVDSQMEDVRPFAGKVGRSTDAELVAGAKDAGFDAIKKGRVAALVLAGGQGTRLGFSGPKGMYDIGLPSGQTLFEMMAARLLRLRTLAGGEGVTVPFYVMTSPMNHDETVTFFKSKNFFGLGEKNVFFFEQGTLPCITEEGKIILEKAGKVAVAPDGNGGVYPALQNSGALDDMTSRGVKYLHVFSIDNALILPADPVFIGYCISEGADCGNKVVWKSHAHEKVGVVANRCGKPCIVEYSEISKEMAELVDDQGRLEFGAGNICNHFYTIDFLKEKVLPNLGDMYHIARKKIPYYDGGVKETVVPTENNGCKLETFIFDVFPLSDKMAVFEIGREDEFSPVKNAPGSASDSPDTARAMMSSQAKKWMVDAGARLVDETEDAVCEISPLVSYSGEGLEEYKGKEVRCPFSV